MSFAAVDAVDEDAIESALAAELFGVFGIDGVHVCADLLWPSFFSVSPGAVHAVALTPWARRARR